jgi:signal transduction histidine kinase/HAMP domain-containing protein
MVILGAATNTLIITKPIKELVAGVKSITSGNFQQRIDLPFGGELGELIRSFNEMAMRLKSYEEQNIEELTAEKAKLETLVSTIADGAILLDSEMKVVLVNPAAAKLFGWSHAHDAANVPTVASTAKAVDTNTNESSESSTSATTQSQTVTLPEGASSEAQATHDLETQINHNLEKNNPAAETVTVAATNISNSDSTTPAHIESTKPEPEAAPTNKTRAQKGVIGMNILHILPQAIATEISRPLLLIASGEREAGEYRITTAAEPGDSNLLTHTLRIWITTVMGSGNILKGIAMTVQDITREVELNAAQARFISNVSHELRTPLFNIKSFIETLYEYGDDLSEEQKKEFLDTANRETDRLTRLVNDVLDLSRLESARQYHFDATDINQPIEQTVRSYQLNARDKGIELVKEVATDLPKVWGNYDLLLQVLANLVGNGLKFTDAGGKVTIRAYAWQDQNTTAPHRSVSRVRIEIEDTGIGIAPEDQERIFNRFYRVENLVHTLEGTGLGLSIVKNIIEKHHSQIYIRSEPGKGTCFWFDLGVFQEKCDLTPNQHIDRQDEGIQDSSDRHQDDADHVTAEIAGDAAQQTEHVLNERDESDNSIDPDLITT